MAKRDRAHEGVRYLGAALGSVIRRYEGEALFERIERVRTRAIDHHRGTANGLAGGIAGDGKRHVRLLQRRQVQRIARLGRVQRVLVGIQRGDQRDHLGLIGRLQHHRHVGPRRQRTNWST